MRNHLLLLAALSSNILTAAPPDRDREAILQMAGTFDVSFEFRETTAIADGYVAKSEPYAASAFELIKVVEDTGDRITLQNMLVHLDAEGTPVVTKHWAQVWTWQDTELLDYAGEMGEHEWKRIRLTEDQARGTWSQLVTQVDDTPRYEGVGKWVHEHGESYWQSEPSRRPLPRREYSKRDDYDYILATNRHSITANGWAHLQDNRKVVDRDGRPPVVLCHEFGVNIYQRTESPHTQAAVEWWEKHGAFWDAVRTFWIESAEQANQSFAYKSRSDAGALRAVLRNMQNEGSAPQTVPSALQPFVVAN